MANEFEQLLPFKWKVSLSLAHDLVEHKYWGVNGARVEDTGIAAARITAVIPIANTIFPGKKEEWTAGALYPDGLRKFIIDFGKRETGFIQHPELGEIACKPEHMEFELAGERQDCTEIRASWVETLDEEFVHRIVANSYQDMELAASDLTASGAALKALVPKLPKFDYDIESLGRALTAAVDTVSTLQYRTAGIVNRIIYQAHRLEVAINRVTVDPASRFTQLRPFNLSFSTSTRVYGTGDPQRPPKSKKSYTATWAVIDAIQQIKAAAFSIRNRALTVGGVGLYTVPADTTLAGVLPNLPKDTSVAVVIRMNPDLMRSPIVPKGAIVRYPLAT
jgi:hypothetical protein